jgi:hypothetical protein
MLQPFVDDQWFKAHWTTPSVRHQMWVRPQQTASSGAELHDIMARVVCHVLIDTLPSSAIGKLVTIVLEMRESYYLAEDSFAHDTILRDSPDHARQFLQALETLRPDKMREYLDLRDEE